MLESGAKRFYLNWLFAMAGIIGIATVAMPAVVSSRAVKPMQPEVALATSAPAQIEPVAPAEEVKPAIAATSLETLIDNFAASQPLPFGVYVINLETGDQASHLPTQKFTSASLYKLFVAEGILRKTELEGFTLTSGQKVCLKAMITVSDNSCGQSLGEVIGWAKYNTTLAKLGYASTQLNRNNIVTSPNDVARFFRRLYQGQMLNAENSKLLTDYLKAQRVTNRLPKGLPAGTEIAHKTGDLNGFMHDAGIVYTPKADYIVVGMSGPWPKSANSFPVFADLSAQLYDWFN